MVLIRVDLTKGVNFVFESHFPTLVKELKEFFDLRLGKFVKHLVWCEVFDFLNNVGALYVEFGEFFSRVAKTTGLYEFRESKLELLSCC